MLQKNAIVFFLDYTWAGKKLSIKLRWCERQKKTELNFRIITECLRNKNFQSSIKVWKAAKTIKYDGENTISYLFNFPHYKAIFTWTLFYWKTKAWFKFNSNCSLWVFPYKSVVFYSETRNEVCGVQVWSMINIQYWFVERFGLSSKGKYLPMHIFDNYWHSQMGNNSEIAVDTIVFWNKWTSLIYTPWNHLTTAGRVNRVWWWE